MIFGMKIDKETGTWLVSLRNKESDPIKWLVMHNNTCETAWKSVHKHGGELYFSDEKIEDWIPIKFTTGVMDWGFPGSYDRQINGTIYSTLENAGFKPKNKTAYASAPCGFHVAVSKGCSFDEYERIRTGKAKLEDVLKAIEERKAKKV